MSIILRIKFQLILVLIPLILTIIWFHNDLIIGKGEEGLNFYNISKHLDMSKSIWIEVNTGMPNLSWLSRAPFFYLAEFLNISLLLPQFIIQAGLFFLLMTTGTISVYYLVSSFLKNYSSNRLIAFLAAIFYLLNPFSMSQVWNRGLYAQYFSFALFPLSLLILVYAFNQKKYFYLIPLLLSSILYSWAFGFVTSIICFWTLLGAYFLWWLFTNKLNKQSLLFGISFFFLFFLGWIIVSAWWLLPLIAEGDKILSSYLSNPGENIGTLLGVSRSYPLDVIVRLLHKGYFFDASAYSSIYSSLPFQLISFLPVLFVLIGLRKIFKEKELRQNKFFVFLLFLGLIVSLGANFPFGWLFTWIFELITPLQSFRNPFEKFGLIYVLGYVPIFAYGLATFFEGKKINKAVIVLVLFLVCGVYAWPMWTGRILAGIDNKIGTKVPSYYEDLNLWLKNNDSLKHRLLMTPLLSGEGAVLQWGDFTYNGVDPMHFILDRVTVSNGAQIPFYFDFEQNIRKYLERENLAPAFSLLRAKFLIDRRDIVKVTDREKDQYKTLTSFVYPPKGIKNDLKTICEDKFADLSLNRVAWINCQIPNEMINLSDIKYLHIKVKTSEPANLEVAVRDNMETRVRWDGSRDVDYRTDTNDWQYITVPLSTPTEYNSSIDLSKILILEVLAHPKDKPLESVKEIYLEEVKLDPGVQRQINEFKEITKIGELSISEVINFNPPPEFGSISSIKIVSDFGQLFEQVNKERDQTDKKGFVVISQNKQKNLQDLENISFSQVDDKQKISDTRYWIKVNQSQGRSLLLLSKTFNSEWKVVVGISKDKLSGNFFDDLDLLKKATLPESNHFVVNGYANLWMLENNQDQLAIIFLPQIYADIGLKISMVFAGVLTLVLGIFTIKRVIKKFA